MNIQDMKLAALNKAMECEPTQNHPDKRGEIEIINFNKTFKITCWCHRLTEFNFYLFSIENGREYSSSISEKEAACFLKGMGLRSST